jgi:HAD superfamily hydrolase (TIGR01509 family)
MTHPTAVLLDVDGTLVDSNDAHALAWAETLTEHGFPVSFERVRALIGEGSEKLLPEITKLEKSSPRGQEIIDARSARFLREHVPRLRAMPCADELVRTLHDRGLRLVIATSADVRELRALLSVLGSSDLLGHQTSSSDVERSKPDPDIVHAAVARAGRPPRECVLIGDTPYDVESARRAGVRTIAFRCGGWSDEALRGAAAIYDGPCDLLASLDRSILFAD